MSYFEATCPACGARYMTGVVGATLMGSHECRVQTACNPYKDATAPKSRKAITAVLRAAQQRLSE